MATRGPKFGQCGPKANQFCTLTQQVYTTSFELDCVNTISDNGRKPTFWAIFGRFWPPEDQNWAKMAPKRITSKHSPNKCSPQVWSGKRGLKANQFWTLIQQMHRPNLKVIEWLLFEIRDPILVKRELNMLCNLLINQLSSGYLKAFKKSQRQRLDCDETPTWYIYIYIYIKFQVHISEHVAKKLRRLSGGGELCWDPLSECLWSPRGQELPSSGSSTKPPFGVFCLPESQKFPNHDEN